MGWKEVIWLVLFQSASFGQENRLISRACYRDPGQSSIHDYTLPDILQRVNIPLAHFRGKVVLIVNLATY